MSNSIGNRYKRQTAFVIRLELNESKEELNIHVTEYANYKIELSNDEIIQHIKDLIGV